MHTRRPHASPSRAFSDAFDFGEVSETCTPIISGERPSLSAKYRLRLYGPRVSISQATGARAQNRPRLSDNERSSDGTSLGLFLVAQAPKLKAFRLDCFLDCIARQV